MSQGATGMEHHPALVVLVDLTGDLGRTKGFLPVMAKGLEAEKCR